MFIPLAKETVFSQRNLHLMQSTFPNENHFKYFLKAINDPKLVLLQLLYLSLIAIHIEKAN